MGRNTDTDSALRTFRKIALNDACDSTSSDSCACCSRCSSATCGCDVHVLLKQRHVVRYTARVRHEALATALVPVP